MIKPIRRLCQVSCRAILIWVASLVALPALAQPERPAFELVYFEDYAPFSYVEDGRLVGVLIEIMNEMLVTRLNLNVQHTGYPWARAQSLIRQGQADAFVTVPTDERRVYAIFTEEPVLRSPFRLFVSARDVNNSDMLAVREFADLKSFSLGGYIGSGWIKTVLEETHGLSVSYAPDLQSALRMLAAERTQILIENAAVVRHNIRMAGLGGHIAELPVELANPSWHLGISHHSTFMGKTELFNQTLQSMWSDGTIPCILSRYEVQSIEKVGLSCKEVRIDND